MPREPCQKYFQVRCPLKDSAMQICEIFLFFFFFFFPGPYFTSILHLHMKKGKHFLSFLTVPFWRNSLFSFFKTCHRSYDAKKSLDGKDKSVVHYSLFAMAFSLSFFSSVSFMARLKYINKSHSGSSVICIIMILRELALLCVKHIIVVKVF